MATKLEFEAKEQIAHMNEKRVGFFEIFSDVIHSVYLPIHATQSTHTFYSEITYGGPVDPKELNMDIIKSILEGMRHGEYTTHNLSDKIGYVHKWKDSELSEKVENLLFNALGRNQIYELVAEGGNTKELFAITQEADKKKKEPLEFCVENRA